MNLYILVEGRHTERKIYPAWLRYISPNMERVDYPSAIRDNNYYLISGEGYPRILDVELKNSLKDISENKLIDCFWVVLDSDGKNIEERIGDIHERINKSGIIIKHCSVSVILQNPCIETWGLGNSSAISQNQLHNGLSDFFHHYDVKSNDPELMRKPISFIGSDASYHESYLKEMLSVNNIRYTKKNPQGLIEKYYLDALIERAANSDGHLKSFKIFYDLASSLQSKKSILG